MLRDPQHERKIFKPYENFSVLPLSLVEGRRESFSAPANSPNALRLVACIHDERSDPCNLGNSRVPQNRITTQAGAKQVHLQLSGAARA